MKPDSEALQELVEKMTNNEAGAFQRKAQLLPSKTKPVFAKPRNNQVFLLANNAVVPIGKKPMTDLTCQEIRTQAMAVEPEVGFVYTSFINNLDNPREWVMNLQALSVIDAEISIDTVFKHLNITPPARLMMRAAVFQYLKSLYWDYARTMKEYGGL
jgi:hypothetical protein